MESEKNELFYITEILIKKSNLHMAWEMTSMIMGKAFI